MNRAALSAALALVDDLGIEDSQVAIDSTLSSGGAKLTAWMDRGVDRAKTLALLGEPSMTWSQGHTIAEWVRGDVRLAVWDWQAAKCPTCGTRKP